MRKLDLDLTIVGSVSILVLLLWSNLSASKDWLIGVLVLLGVFLCSYNVFINCRIRSWIHASSNNVDIRRKL